MVFLWKLLLSQCGHPLWNGPNFCLDCDFWLPLPLFKTILLLALPQLLPIGFAFSDFYLYTARWFYGLMHTFRCDL